MSNPASQEQGEEQAVWGERALREARWPASVAVILAIVLYVTLPSRLTLGPIWLLPTLEAALLLPLSIMSPYRHPEETRAGRLSSLALIAIISAFNLVALGFLLYDLLQKGVSDAHQLIFSSMQIWLTNVIVFGLWYWELDRGGPAARRGENRREPDFLFPQMSTPVIAASGVGAELYRLSLRGVHQRDRLQPHRHDASHAVGEAPHACPVPCLAGDHRARGSAGRKYLEVTLVRFFRRSRPARPRQALLYSRAGCHLCEDARRLLDRLAPKYGLEIHEIDISGDPDLVRRYDIRIPVVVVDGGQEIEAPIEERNLRRALERS